jgi:hypothetical protein
MTLGNPPKAVEYTLISARSFQPHSAPPSNWSSIFFGPNGLRVGWCCSPFVSIVVVLLGCFLLVRNGGPQGLRDAQKHLGQVTVTPFLMGSSEAIAFVLLCIATLIMGKSSIANSENMVCPGVEPGKRILDGLRIGKVRMGTQAISIVTHCWNGRVLDAQTSAIKAL